MSGGWSSCWARCSSLRPRSRNRPSPGRCGTRPAGRCPVSWSRRMPPDRSRSRPKPTPPARTASRSSPASTELTFTLINFGPVRRPLAVAASGTHAPTNVVLHLSLNADITVTGKRTFANLADVERPAENLVGIAQSASQGAITARQLDARPIMRTGEVLETVPGVVITQHSGDGKANQYYLRGFNLDHGTDFATTVAGMPVNMPTHGHGHGYSDLNFMIPELVSGVQFSKGPYFAEQGDFTTAGASNINYVTALDRPIARAVGGGEGFGRVLVAASPAVGRGRLLAAFEMHHNDGPWVNPDNYRKVNGVLRYSRGDSVNGLAITGMAYRGQWNSTDQVPQRAIDSGRIDRFGALDTSDGGDTYRYSGTVEWQQHARQRGDQGHGLRHRLRPEPVLELHLLPRRSGRRRSVPAGGSPLHHRRQGHLQAARPLAGPRDAELDRCAAAQRHHHQRRAVSHRAASASRHDSPGRGAADERRRLRPERNGVDAVAADDDGRPRRRLPVRCRLDRSGQQRHRVRRAGQPEGRRRDRTVQRHRVLRQRRRSGSTATTRAARRSRATRQRASRRIA